MQTDRFEPYGYAALRIVAGAMFACHGIQKVLSMWLPPEAAAPAFPSQMWFGGVIELLCGVLVALGLFVRPAAFLASGTMAVAYFQFHWKLKLASWMWLPLVNGGEEAALYCFVFLLFSIRGAGPYSIDAQLAK